MFTGNLEGLGSVLRPVGMEDMSLKTAILYWTER